MSKIQETKPGDLRWDEIDLTAAGDYIAEMAGYLQRIASTISQLDANRAAQVRQDLASWHTNFNNVSSGDMKESAEKLASLANSVDAALSSRHDVQAGHTPTLVK